MFRRAKLMLADLAPLITGNSDQTIVATVDLTDDCGGPRCARLRAPALRPYLVTLTGSRRPRTAAIQRHLRTASEPEPPGPVRSLTDTDPRAIDTDVLVAESQPNRTAWVEQVNSVVVHGDSES